MANGPGIPAHERKATAVQRRASKDLLAVAEEKDRINQLPYGQDISQDVADLAKRENWNQARPRFPNR